MLNTHEFEKLLHDIKRISKAFGIYKTEKNKETKEIIGSLLEDEINRLADDLEEAKEKNGGKLNA